MIKTVPLIEDFRPVICIISFFLFFITYQTLDIVLALNDDVENLRNLVANTEKLEIGEFIQIYNEETGYSLI